MNLEKDSAPTGFYDYLPQYSSLRRKTTRRRKPLIGKLKPGLMKAVGYDVNASVTRRHKAVKRAVKKYGKSSTIKKLNAVAVYTRRTSPAKSKKFKADMKFAQKMKGGDDKLRALGQLSYDLEEAMQAEADPEYVTAKDTPDGFRKQAKDLGVTVTDTMSLEKLKDAVDTFYTSLMRK